MDPIQSGANPTNNPRLDLLHNTGNNQQLSGAAGTYGPDATAFHQQGVNPTPPEPVKPAAAYVAAAQAKQPETPVPMPEPAAPEPRPAPTPTTPTPPPPTSGSGTGRKIFITFIILLILAAAGVGGWWWWTHRAQQPAKPAGVAVTPVTPTNLLQLDSSKTSLDAGATTSSSKVTFEFNVHTSATSGSLTPEVEVEPVLCSKSRRGLLVGLAPDWIGSIVHLITLVLIQ